MSWPGSTSDPEELRRCIRDLIAISALPAVWSTMLPARIVESVAGSLVSMLDAELVLVSLDAAAGAAAIQHGHTRLGPANGMLSGIRKSFESWLSGNARDRLNPIPNPFGGGALHVALARIGFGNGVIIAASLNAAFPSPRQRLVLDIAADETAIGLHHWNSEQGQHRFTALVERSSDFIGIADLDGRATYLNLAGLNLVGLDSLDSIPGLGISDFIADVDREKFQQAWVLFRRHGRWSGELRFRHFRGEDDIPVLVDWFGIEDPRTKKPLNMATVGIDLRTLKATEEELRRLNDTLETRVAERTTALEESNERLRVEMAEREIASARLEETLAKLFHASRLSATGQMAARLAHEMSQPLAALTLSVSAAARLLAKARPDSIDLAGKALNEAAAQIARTNKIVKHLRDYVGPGKPTRRMEDVRSILDEATSFAMFGADSLDVDAVIELDPDASMAYVDRVQIQQVLVNLVRNALEAMSGNERGRELSIRAAPVGNEMIEIAVADRGPGLPQDVAEHLFEPFITTKREGMGLGLSICQSIVNAHGGLIRSEPNRGGGTIFAFTLQATRRSR
jgi:PAS domain S-box-containing protein